MNKVKKIVMASYKLSKYKACDTYVVCTSTNFLFRCEKG